MSRALRALWVLALMLGAVTAGEPSWYWCDCDEADDPSNCMCPSLDPPGGIPREKAPQFILFTHDDSIESDTDSYMRQVCDGKHNPNGCPVRATMFTMVQYTDCELTYDMWQDGYEIADHTVSHPAMPDGYPKDKTEDEILGMRSWLAEECGIPEEEVKGFRNPYLKTNPVVREVLHENGFLYDSTLMEGRSHSLSYPMAERVWPYTLDFGIAQNCGWFAPDQICKDEERYPGLWEIPMWTMSATGKEYTMDYGDNDKPLWDILKANFDETYNGNRAPLPIYIHTPWFNDDRIADLQKFVDYTLDLGDVYWVTMSQLLNWMKNPLPAAQMKYNGAMCGNAPPPPPPPPPPFAMPHSGVKVTLDVRTEAGAGRAQFSPEFQARLVAEVKKQMGWTATSVLFRSLDPAPAGAATHTPPAHAPSAHAPAAHAPPAPTAPAHAPASSSGAAGAGVVASAGGQRRRLLAQTQAQGQGPLSTSEAGGFLQFEAPSFAGFRPRLPARAAAGGGTVAAADLGGEGDEGAGEQEGGDTWRVVIVVAAPEPFTAYNKALGVFSGKSLNSTLGALNLTAAGTPVIVPFKNGVALSLPPPPSPPPPPTPLPPAVVSASEDGSSPSGDAAQTPGTAAAAGSPSDGGSSGLPTWAIAEIAAFSAGAVLLAIAAAVGVVYWRRRRRERAAAAAASTFSATAPEDGSDADSRAALEEEKAKEEERPHTAITLDATTPAQTYN